MPSRSKSTLRARPDRARPAPACPLRDTATRDASSQPPSESAIHFHSRMRRGRPCRESSRRDRAKVGRSEEHTSELQSRQYLVCRLLLEKKKPYITRAPDSVRP